MSGQLSREDRLDGHGTTAVDRLATITRVICPGKE
jgi:hypothetical protein